MMTKPNVLIFMTDHQRGDTVLKEHPTITPSLDAFAAEGLTFAQTYCPAPHCCPARATFHTGLYPTRTGIWNNVCNRQALQLELNEGVRVWGEDLAAAGYDMAYVGKWHVAANDRPADHGWKNDQYASALTQAGEYHGQTWEQYRELAGAPVSGERLPGRILRPGWGDSTVYGSCTRADHGDTRRLKQAHEEFDRLLAGDAPWALCVNTAGPHDPYVVPQEYLDMYDPADVPLPASFADEMADKPRVYQRMRRQVWGQMSEDEYRDAIRHFRAYCTFLDDLFGSLLKKLEASGRTEDTLVLYCSDHGDYCGEHGLFAKGIPAFRGAYHVPAVMRWPAGITAPGRRVEELVSLADFGPTFLEAAGIRADRAFSGASLMPFLRNTPPADWRDDMLMMCNGVELYYTQRILQTRTHKYVYNGFDEDELYDLVKDPHEMVNVSDRTDYRDIKRDLVGRMWRAMHREDDTATNGYITVALAPWGPAEAFRPSP